MFYIVANHSVVERYPAWFRVEGLTFRTEEEASIAIAWRRTKGQNAGRRELPNDQVVVVAGVKRGGFEVEIRHAADASPVVSVYCEGDELAATLRRLWDQSMNPTLPAKTSGEVF